MLMTDVLNFYPSIYTHSISWALHGKALAKAQMNNAALAGNSIDRAVREGQEGQTMGIPIGPDSSWVIAETILARVDETLRARITGLKGHRFNDDVTFYFSSLSQAENAIGVFQEALAEFELSINPRKTTITELPNRIEAAGIDELRSWQFRPGPRAQKTDILAYFDRLADLIVADRGGHTASYAVARLREQPFLSGSWPLLEACLLHLLVAEPYCARHVATTLSMLTGVGHHITKAALSEANDRLITRHATLGHGSEVSWALWLSVAHNAPLTQSATSSASQMDDNLVALLTMYAETKGLITGVLDKTRWADMMTAEELRGSNWLVSYEARVKGWLPSKGVADHLASEPFFAAAAAAGTSFFDVGGFTLPHQPALLPPAGGGGGAGYLI